MYSTCEDCPFCQSQKNVVYWGKNEGPPGTRTQRFKCRACNKTFTKNPKSKTISPEKERLIQNCLEERLSIEAIARTTNSAKRTVYNVLKKQNQQSNQSN